MFKKILIPMVIFVFSNIQTCPPPHHVILEKTLQTLKIPLCVQKIILKEQKKCSWLFNIEIDEELKKIVIVNNTGKVTHLLPLSKIQKKLPKQIN